MCESYQSPPATPVHNHDFKVRKSARVYILRYNTRRCNDASSLAYDLKQEIATLKRDIRSLKGEEPQDEDGERLALRSVKREMQTSVQELNEERYWSRVWKHWDMHEIDEELERVKFDLRMQEEHIQILRREKNRLEAKKRRLDSVTRVTNGQSRALVDSVEDKEVKPLPRPRVIWTLYN